MLWATDSPLMEGDKGSVGMLHGDLVCHYHENIEEEEWKD